MKPQLTVMDAGYHNADIEKTRMRLLKGGSWKKQRIVVVIPTGESLPAKAALSHWNLIFPPNQAVFRFLAQGMEVGDAYSSAIAEIIAHPELNQWEYILTCEHDNVIPADGVIKLLAQMEAHPEFACIGGLYYTKFENGVAQLWGDVNDPIINFRPQVPIPGALMECVGAAMGFHLFRMSMFKDERIKRPWFRTITQGGVATQDLEFWREARQYGYRCAVDCDVRVGHYDVNTDILW